MMQLLLFVPLTFVIAPIFAVERSSGMDNLILSSRNGRRKIITAKLLSVLVSSAGVTLLYLTATFIFGFLPHGSFHGWDAAIQSVPTYARSMFQWKVWQLAAVGAVWLIFTGAVYSLIVCFISSLILFFRSLAIFLMRYISEVLSAIITASVKVRRISSSVLPGAE